MAENTLKSWLFEVKNNAQTLTKQLQNNFEKVQKTTFLTPKIVKNDPSNPPKWAYFWPKISIFWGHLSTIGAENTPKSGPFKTEKDA